MQEPAAITQMPRRAFLAWGSALAMGTLGGKAFGASPVSAAASIDAPAALMTVGYGAPLLAEASPIVEAASLPAGDAEFVERGARVTIFGLEGMEPTSAPDEMKSLTLEVAYPGIDGAQPILVHVWHFANGSAAHASPRNSFVVPVGRDSGLNLVLETKNAAGERKRAACRFTVGTGTGLPKLQRGIYALAPSDAPGWRGLAWSPGEAARPRLVRPGTPEGMSDGPSFPCLALTVDYSKSGVELCA